MQKILLIAILFYSTTIFGQTKKIAFRSHSGDLSFFVTDAPDDFGWIEPTWNRPQLKMISIQCIKLDTLLDRVDTLQQCHLLPNPLLVPISKRKIPKKRLKTKPKKKRKIKSINEASIINQTTTFPNLEPSLQQSKYLLPDDNNKNLAWLGLFLLLPSGFMFFSSKK